MALAISSWCDGQQAEYTESGRKTMIQTRYILFFALLGALLPHSMQGQVVLDDGSFVVLQNGQPVGTETFTIRRSGFGDNTVVIVQATIELDRLGRTEALRARLNGAGLNWFAYEAKISGDAPQELSIVWNGQHFVASSRSDRGQLEQEFRGGANAVILDRTVAHLYYFIGRKAAATNGSFLVIQARPGTQSTGRVEEVGLDRLDVGGELLRARHLRLTLEGEAHDFWIDEDGRLLRVRVPSQGYEARRREAP